MTDFKDILIKYMEELDCSSKELACLLYTSMPVFLRDFHLFLLLQGLQARPFLA